MALKNLFDMVKADRYTQDGREALIKAQEAETEDATRRTYQIGEISQATGLQKTANGWVKPKNGKQPGAKKEEVNKSVTSKKDEIWKDMKKREGALRAKGMTSRHFMDDPEYAHLSELYKNEMEAESKTEELEGNQPAVESIGRDEKLNKVRQVLNTALTPSGDKVQMTKSKVTGDFHVLLNGKSTGGGFRDPQKAKEEFNAWIAGKKAPSESAKERINKRFDESEARSQKAMEAAEKLPAKPTRGMSESYIRGTQLMKPAEDELQRGEQQWAGVLSGYDNTSVLEQRKQLQEKYDEFEEDIKDYDRRGLAPAVYAKRINQQNFIKGALKAIDDEMENRGMDPAPRTSVPDAAPRVLTGDTRIRVRK